MIDVGRLEIDMKKTGERIKRLCEENGVTVKKIQSKLHIGAFQSIYNWFSGKSLPSLDNMYKLSKLLRVTIEDLIIDNSGKCLHSVGTCKDAKENYLFVYYKKLMNIVSVIN